MDAWCYNLSMKRMEKIKDKKVIYDNAFNDGVMYRVILLPEPLVSSTQTNFFFPWVHLFHIYPWN